MGREENTSGKKIQWITDSAIFNKCKTIKIPKLMPPGKLHIYAPMTKRRRGRRDKSHPRNIRSTLTSEGDTKREEGGKTKDQKSCLYIKNITNRLMAQDVLMHDAQKKGENKQKKVH